MYYRPWMNNVFSLHFPSTIILRSKLASEASSFIEGLCGSELPTLKTQPNNSIHCIDHVTIGSCCLHLLEEVKVGFEASSWPGTTKIIRPNLSKSWILFCFVLFCKRRCTSHLCETDALSGFEV